VIDQAGVLTGVSEGLFTDGFADRPGVQLPPVEILC
jgi:hypothetical protein